METLQDLDDITGDQFFVEFAERLEGLCQGAVFSVPILGRLILLENGWNK
jgi:GGDEF domain-containing protein